MNKLFITTIAIFGLILLGCKEEPNEVTELEVDAVVEQMAGFGWEANQIVKTGSEVQDVTQESDLLEGTDVEVGGGSAMTQSALRLFGDAQKCLIESKGIFKATGDSLYFYDDHIPGLLKVGYYDSETDIVRYYEVRTQFPFWRPNIRYDSLQVTVIANGTPFNPFDDTLQTFHQTQKFKETYFVQTIVGDIVITDYTPTEITGAELTQNTYYHSSRYLSHLRRSADINPDQSGTLREDFNYKDGKTAYNEFTYNGDYTGTFAKQYRDGTEVTGTFDMIHDNDLYGAMTETIDFPSGRYLDKIERAAEVEIILPDSIFSGSFFEAIYFSSGRVDTSSIDITVDETDSVKTTVLDVTKKNDAHGIMTIKEYADYSTVEGNWTTWNDYYISIFDTQFYVDGSGHIHYKVWSSTTSFNNGDPAILEVEYYFSPDNEGSGTLTYESQIYDISADGSGQGIISLGGKTKQFNLLQ